MGKSHLSGEDIKARYITPAITDAGWDIKKQIRLEYAFTAGRIILRGNITARGKQKRADYVLVLCQEKVQVKYEFFNIFSHHILC